MKKMKKVIALLTSILMLSSLPLSVAAEAEMQPCMDTIISDDFTNQAYRGSISGDPVTFDPTANLGIGWNGTWSFSNSSNNIRFYTGWRDGVLCAQYDSTFISRNLANVIDFSKDGKYEIRFKNKYGTSGGEPFVGLSLSYGDGLYDNVLTFGEKDNGANIAIHSGNSTIASTSYDGDNKFKGQILYNNVVQIIVNSNGNDTIKYKRYAVGTAEPSEWNLETNYELNEKTASKIRVRYYQGGISEIEIRSSEISVGKDVIEGSGTDFAKVNDQKEDTTWAANNDYAIIDMQKPVKITSYEALGLNDTFELYSSENGNVENAEKIADLSSGKNEVSDAKVGRYVIVKGTGSLGEINLWGDGYADDYLNVPEIYAGSERVLGNKNVLSSNEKIVVDFDENVTVPTSGAVTLTVDGKSVPVTYTASDDKITVVTSKALEGDCTLTVSGDITDADGNKMPEAKAFTASFKGIKDVEVTTDTIKNNSASSVTLVPVTVSGNTVTAGSSITVSGNDSQSYSGNIVVNDFTSLSPASVSGATTNTVTIDDEIVVDKDTSTATVTGFVYGVNMQKIGGRDVVVAVTSMSDNLEASKIIDMKKTVSKDDGSFSVSLKMDESKSGFFKPYVATNYSTAPATGKFYYISEAGETSILGEFTNATTVDAMKTAISANLTDMGIEASSYNTAIDTLVANIADEILKAKPFETVSDIAEAVRGALVKEDVKNSTADQIKTILENKYEDFGAVNTGWAKLNDSEKTAVAENIFASKADIKTTADLKELYNAFVEEQLQTKSPVTVPEADTTNVSTNVGESVVMSISLNDSKVNSLKIVVTYDKKTMTFVKHTSKNSKLTVADSNNAKAKAVEDNATVTITLPQTSATENSYTLSKDEPIKLEFMPNDGNAFSTTATVSSEMAVYDSKLGIMREYSQDKDITVSASAMNGESNPTGSVVVTPGTPGTSGGSYSGGGSSGSSKGDFTGSYTPTGGATTAPKEDEKTDKFTDLANCEWAKEAIDYLADNDIINGIGENTFAPDSNVKREEFAKMLVLAFNLYDSEATCNFSDVKTSDWFYVYVASAVENNLINGMDENTFGTGEYITREQMTAMLYRAIMKFAPYVTYEKEVEYADESNISDWAVESVNAMSYFGAVKGMGDNTFAPQGTATRAQSACIIYRVLQLFDETIGK